MTTTARVTLTVEIEAGGSWGEECQLKQVYEQAELSAMNQLRKAFHNTNSKIRIIGKPTTEAIMQTSAKK